MWKAVPVLLTCLVGCTVDLTPRKMEGLGGDSRLVPMFRQAERETGVPAEVLATVAFTTTRLTMVRPDDHGPPIWGVMALGGSVEVDQAAALAGLAPDAVRLDPQANIRAAAAVMRDRAPGDWAAALVAYGGEDLAAEVRRHLGAGWRGVDDEGKGVTVTAQDLERGQPLQAIAQALGYSKAKWNPAYSGNYANASRGEPGTIRTIVIHTMQGSYGGSISWFQNPTANVSAHYMVRSSDGEITQMVDHRDIAYHDACFNTYSIGIEHEGYVTEPGKWYTEEMYMASARLTAWIAGAHGIPKDRAHIMGHGETPDCSNHTDPGPGWNWKHYLELVNGGGTPRLAARAGKSSYPPTMVSGQNATAWFEFVNDGNILWGTNETRLATQDPASHVSPFFVSGNWLSTSQATGADRSDYDPGDTGRFSFVIRAPHVTARTTVEETFQLYQQGNGWFGPKVTMTITVDPVAAPQALPAPDARPAERPATLPPSRSEDGGIPLTASAEEPPADEAGQRLHASGCSVTPGRERPTALIVVVLVFAALRRRRQSTSHM